MLIMKTTLIVILAALLLGLQLNSGGDKEVPNTTQTEKETYDENSESESHGEDKLAYEFSPNIPEETENEGEADAETEPKDRLSYEFSPNIPERTKFEGETFSLLIGSVGNYIYAEEETSGLLNDAAYRRNMLVSERFGVEMNIVKSGYDKSAGQAEATAYFRSLIEANDDTYHAFTHVQHTGMPQMILEKRFVDWNTIPYINLEDEWWCQDVTNDLSFGDKVYVMTGDYAVYIDTIDCLVFNKDIFDELGLEYPYQDVLDGTWTWDKFEELVAQGSEDLNGDGLMTVDDDRWGLIGWVYELAPALLVSTGYAPLEKDADNMPVLNRNVDEAHGMYDRVVNLFVDGQKSWAGSAADEYSKQLAVFSEGRAMFKDVFLGGITGFTDVEFDFGIIPYPKWDENSEYQNRSSNMSPLTYIPVTNNNIEMTGAVLEEMAYQSAKTVTPTYFDIVLTAKGTRDVESEEMLPIIKNNARFLYDGFQPGIFSMVQNKKNTYASTYASNLSFYQESLEEMRELLEED